MSSGVKFILILYLIPTYHFLRVNFIFKKSSHLGGAKRTPQLLSHRSRQMASHHHRNTTHSPSKYCFSCSRSLHRRIIQTTGSSSSSIIPSNLTSASIPLLILNCQPRPSSSPPVEFNHSDVTMARRGAGLRNSTTDVMTRRVVAPDPN